MAVTPRAFSRISEMKLQNSNRYAARARQPRSWLIFDVRCIRSYEAAHIEGDSSSQNPGIRCGGRRSQQIVQFIQAAEKTGRRSSEVHAHAERMRGLRSRVGVAAAVSALAKSRPVPSIHLTRRQSQRPWPSRRVLSHESPK